MVEQTHQARPDVEVGPLQQAVLDKFGWKRFHRPEFIGHHFSSIDGRLELYLIFGESETDGHRRHWMHATVSWAEDPSSFTMRELLYDSANDLETFLTATRAYIDVCWALRFQ